MSTPPTGSPNMDVTSTDVKVVSQDMGLLSNVLAAYTFITDQPERTGLVFLGGVCVGLFVTLCAIVFQIHCRADCHYGKKHHPRHHHGNRRRHSNRQCPRHNPGNQNPDDTAVVATVGEGPSGESESEDWDDTTSDLSARRRRRFERTLLHARMFTSAEELERAQRLEERERILREIWMNGQPDLNTVTQSLNRYY